MFRLFHGSSSYYGIRKPSSSEGFDGTPYLPNQLQSTGCNFFSSTPQSSNFNSGNPASSYYPFNQSAQLNSSTNFVPSEAGTHSTNFFGEIRKTMREIFIRWSGRKNRAQ
uniref:Uncharacterized protein n=1 Tax=Globodera rostochiensis TaxID=31243 RepID=A0A914HZB3_GLORO